MRLYNCFTKQLHFQAIKICNYIYILYMYEFICIVIKPFLTVVIHSFSSGFTKYSMSHNSSVCVEGPATSYPNFFSVLFFFLL